jgi:hypothetical protein
MEVFGMGRETSMILLWTWLAAMLAAFPARAETLELLELRLYPDAGWQRGAPQEEQEDDALRLSWPAPDGVALQVLVPRNPPLLKSDAETFYRNLTRKWTAQYGKQAAIGWIDFGPGGTRWLGCRRPSSTGSGVVFHLATVHEGRAYSLLAFAPPGTESLPPAVRDLVQGAAFQAPPTPWRHRLSLALLPQGEALEALAQAEADALGNQGMLTGYGVGAEKSGKPGQSWEEAGEVRLNWFLEGFRWVEVHGRDERQPFEVRGQLVAVPPPRMGGGGPGHGIESGGIRGGADGPGAIPVLLWPGGALGGGAGRPGAGGPGSPGTAGAGPRLLCTNG